MSSIVMRTANMLLYRNDWAIVLVLLMTSPVSSTNSTNVGKYKLQDGCYCKTSDVIFTKQRDSEVICAIECKVAENCTGFLYGETTYECVGCSNTSTETEQTNTGEYQCWNEEIPPSDCVDVLSDNKEATDGVYKITTAMGTQVDVYCIMSERGGGWTTMLRRFNGEVKFDRLFGEYETGFGDKAGEHWLGLRCIHEMTTQTPSDLLITTVGGLGMFGIPDKEYFEEWSDFYILSEPYYAVHIGALKNWTYENRDTEWVVNASYGYKFSTKDVVTDIQGQTLEDSCSSLHGQGGWWYADCSTVINPTGIYLPPGFNDHTSMYNQQVAGYFAMREMTVMYRRRLTKEN